MLQPNIRVGSRRVLVSGSVAAIGYETVSMTVADLEFEFVFSQKNDSPNSVDLVQPTPKSLRLSFVNVDSSLGVAWDSFVGQLNGGQLHLILYISSVGEGPGLRRQLHYTFTQEGGMYA